MIVNKFPYNEEGSQIVEQISEQDRTNAKKRLIKRLSKFQEVSNQVKKLQGEENEATDPVEELGQEIIEMNVKMEKMSEIITSCHNLLKK